MKGEGSPNQNSDRDSETKDSVSNEYEDADSFAKASVWKRIAIVVAGPVFNLILAFVISFVLIAVCGQDKPLVTDIVSPSIEEAGLEVGDEIVEMNGHSVGLSRELYFNEWYYQHDFDDTISLKVKRNGSVHDVTYPVLKTEKYALGISSGTDKNSNMVIMSFLEGSAAEAAGMEIGDIITAIDGIEPSDSFTLNDYLQQHPLDGSSVTLSYIRDGDNYGVAFKPSMTEVKDIGFGYATNKTPSTNILKDTLLEMKYNSMLVMKSLSGLLTGRFGVSDLSGPVAIVKEIGDDVSTASSVQGGSLSNTLNSLMSLIIMISVNLGIFNLLPIPALDGGHLVFLIIEAIRRKPVKPSVELLVHQVGLSILMLLSVFVIIKDMWNLLF